MACQRSMTQKKREKRGVTMSQKKEIGMIWERKAITSRSKSYPSIHPLIHLHLFDRDCMTCFSMDPLFDFTINRIQVCPILILPWAPQRLVVVGKIKGKHCPSKEIQDECLERVILGALPWFQKSFKKKSVSRWIADLWTSKYYFMHRPNSQQPKTRRQLKSPMRD